MIYLIITQLKSSSKYFLRGFYEKIFLRAKINLQQIQAFG